MRVSKLLKKMRDSKALGYAIGFGILFLIFLPGFLAYRYYHDNSLLSRSPVLTNFDKQTVKAINDKMEIKLPQNIRNQQLKFCLDWFDSVVILYFEIPEDELEDFLKNTSPKYNVADINSVCINSTYGEPIVSYKYFERYASFVVYKQPDGYVAVDLHLAEDTHSFRGLFLKRLKQCTFNQN